MTVRQRFLMIAMGAVLGAGNAGAADRSIALNPVNTSSWEFPTHTNAPRQRPQMGVGFWQRASGAKPGVGSNYISAMEYQLPEAAPARVRSASFQFSGRASQCTGAEPVVIEVFAYAGNGKADLADTQAGSRVAQLSADCSSNPAFARPIDVTAMVRQLAVPSGVRHVGFNIRKGNNRQGPGLFGLAAGKLTVVLADAPLAGSTATVAAAPRGATAATAAAATGVAAPVRAAQPLPPEKPKRVKKTLEDLRTDR
jgi:hypothetical protein